MKRLQTLPTGQRAWIQHILTWVVLVKRQLSPWELEAGVCISRHIAGQIPDGLYNFDTTISLCGAIIQVVGYTEGGGSFERGLEHVSVVHDSIKQFLTNRMANTFYVDPPIGNTLLARSCLHQMVVALKNNTVSFAEEDFEVSRRYLEAAPLFCYSSVFFSQHLLTAFPHDELDFLVTEFLVHFEAWLKIMFTKTFGIEVIGFLDCSDVSLNTWWLTCRMLLHVSLIGSTTPNGPFLVKLLSLGSTSN
jgi:hypothetical protein